MVAKYLQPLNIDNLAANGIIFTDAHESAPFCSNQEQYYLYANINNALAMIVMNALAIQNWILHHLSFQKKK